MALRFNLLPLSIIALLLVTSCAQQKFAFRKKLPVNREESTVKVKEQKNAGEPVANAGITEIPAVAGVASAVPVRTGMVSENDFVKKQDALNKAPVVSESKGIKPIEKASVKKAWKKLNDKKNNLDVTASSINPRQFIIIGLIILLIGVVLSIVLSGLGYLVAVVGVVFIVIGLIVMLADQL
jgi:hypothetical protein